MAVVKPDYLKMSRDMLIEFAMSGSQDGNLLEELNTITTIQGIMVIFEGIENVDNLHSAAQYGANDYQVYHIDFPKSYPVNMLDQGVVTPDEKFRLNTYLNKKTIITS